MTAHRSLHDLYRAPFLMNDPGASGTITVDRWGAMVPIVSATAEARTLAVPTKAGLLCTVLLDDDGGDVTLTVTSGYNQTGDTSITLDTAGDFVTFISVKIGANYRWRIVAQEGTGATVTDVTAESIATDALNLTVNAVNAAGNNQANAGELTLGLNIVGAADNTTGVILPDDGSAGQVVIVKSTVASKTLPVYPPSTGQIDGGGANNAATLDAVAAGASAVFVATNATTWYTVSGDLA